jgi:site-specific DNA-cytosine methylase
MTPLPAAEFFAGIGLVRAGLENAGFHVVLANDNDPTKFRMYAKFDELVSVMPLEQVEEETQREGEEEDAAATSEL